MVPAILTERVDPTAAARGAERPLSADEQAASARLKAAIAAEIARAGFMPFARFMELALYAPGMGYYAAGAAKLGAGGDYVTAPELTPLFGAALAAQVKELLEPGPTRILELGAGTGRMAFDLIGALAGLGVEVERYSILEVSADLRERQRATLERLAARDFARVEWLAELPERCCGVIIGNEVLDALPVHLVRGDGDAVEELGVTCDDSGAFAWAARPARGALAELAARLALPPGYTTEVHLAARALVRSLAATLERGACLFLDYGFPRHEYYHPQRRQGTLMCHYRHRAHGDPFVLAGLQDITAHVEFTGLAEAAIESGLELLGYTGQAQFLINCGILELLAAVGPENAASYAPQAARVQPLLSPAEMGELYKVIAFGRGISRPLLGFGAGDRSRALLP